MNNESKALELANRIHGRPDEAVICGDAAAAELRRQHAEIESLRAQLAQRVPDGLVLKVLRDLEWMEVRHEYRESEWYCPVCEGDKRQGHAAGCELAEAMLSAAPSQQAPVQGEPVAWLEQVTLSSGGYSPPTKEWRVTQNPSTSKAPRKPLYTHPQQASKPMTWDEVKKTIRDAHHIAWSKYGRMASDEEICRAVERHHKIGEKQ
jgi:hypothetical protein